MKQIRQFVSKHNNCCKSLSALNILVKYKLAITYFCLIPIIDIGLLIALSDDTTNDMRIITSIIMALISLICVKFSLDFAALYQSANKCYTSLNSIISRNQFTISVNDKISLSNIIERMSQTAISFTIYDFFPFNYYQLLQFYIEFIKFFFLMFSLYNNLYNI